LEGNIIFAGFRSDIDNLLYGSDIYINSSQHEALSFLILEALASGLPLIATNMGGNPDIINAETDCGILVEYDDTYSLAQALLKVMDDEKLRRHLSENAVKAVNERFNLDIASEETYNLYKEICT
jgi:glycosyltransferase involved in cell wall biosynthesis